MEVTYEESGIGKSVYFSDIPFVNKVTIVKAGSGFTVNIGCQPGKEADVRRFLPDWLQKCKRFAVSEGNVAFTG